MVKVYATTLILGFLVILLVVMGGTLAENLDRPDRDPDRVLGPRIRLGAGALLGFGIGGMAAEFSPLEITWQVALLIALATAAIGAIWVRYAGGRPAGT